MGTDATRQKLRHALDRLIAGTPVRTDGRLTVSCLAREADVSRATAHRYPDVIVDLQAAIDHPPASGSSGSEPEPHLVERNAQLAAENRLLRAEKEAMANALYVLAELDVRVLR